MYAEMAAVEKLGVQLLLKAPFYAHFLMGIPKSFDETVATAGLRLYGRSMIQLSINPGFWNTLSEDHRLGLIQHEILHIALGHLNRVKACAHPRLYFIATDLVVNQYIESKLLPANSIRSDLLLPFEQVLGIRIEQGQGVEYYYRLLLDILQKFPLPAPGNASSQQACRELESWLRDDHEAMKKHEFWGEWSQLTGSEERILEHFVRTASRQALERTGQPPDGLPGALWECLEKAHPEPSPVNWRRILRLFAASGTSTCMKSTIRRPSKRYGAVPGIRLHRRHHLALAIDTSGSISASEMRLFFSEVWQIWRQGAQITIIECDHRLRRVYHYSGNMPGAVSGRGGTRFDEPIQWVNEHLPDALIYFTDGLAPPPRALCRKPVLWVIPPQARADVSHLPGRVLRMSEL